MTRESLPLLIDPQPRQDEALWRGYSAVPRPSESTSDLLLPPVETVEAERRTFYDSQMEYLPNLRPMHDAGAFDNYMDAWRSHKRTLHEAGEDPALIAAYRWRINEQIANLGMVKAAITGDDKAFTTYNQFIYGLPNRPIFAAVADSFCVQAEQVLEESPKRDRQEAAEAVLEHLHGQRGDQSILIPDARTFAEVRKRHFGQNGFYDLLLEGVRLPADGKISQETGDPIVRQVISNVGSNYDINDARGKAWSIDHENEAIRRPVGYSLPVPRFLGLVCGHEVGSHLLERVNGERTAVRLLQDGFDRMEFGNEGRAVIREQIVYPDFDAFTKLVRWQDIMRRQLATSLAYDYNGEAMNFAKVYRVINAIDRLWQHGKKPGDPQQALETAHGKSWRLLESIYKGTEGHGTPYGRYAQYLEGNVACWGVARQNPSAIDAGDTGKFDITNARHRSIVDTYTGATT